MLVVVASRRDRVARRYVERATDGTRVLLTPEDLSRAGWRHVAGKTGYDVAVIGDRPVPAREIVAIITRLPAVTAADLTCIRPQDRDYVAAEMTAFLAAWLSAFKGPVLNRPTATSLIGPAWPPEVWRAVGARLGIPVQPLRRTTLEADAAGCLPAVVQQVVCVTIVAGRCLGAPDASTSLAARRLAAAAGADLLQVSFSPLDRGAFLQGATCDVDLDDPTVATAIDAYLDSSRARHVEADA